MNADDVDMEGHVLDRALERATRLVAARTEDMSAFAGMWVDTDAREIHVAFTGPDAHREISALQAEVPPEIRLRGHAFPHPMSELEALQSATSEYLDHEGYWALHGVDLGVRVKSNRVHLNLRETTPPEVEAAIRARFQDAPLDIELTTSRWVAQ